MAQNISYKSTFRGAVFFFPLSNIPRICSNCALVMSLGYFFLIFLLYRFSLTLNRFLEAWSAGCYDYLRCMVHMVRSSLKYVASKDMKSFAADLKSIYNAACEGEGLKARDRVVEKWSAKYPASMKRWIENWDVVVPIFKFSQDIRKIIYTTNAMESLHSSYRKLKRRRSVFPSDQALLKALYLATFEATKNGLSRFTTGLRPADKCA